MVKQAALLFVLVLTGVGAFQLTLILGAPWGEFTLGGRWRGRLPPKIRLIPLFSLVLLGFFGAIILARSDLALPGIHEQSRTLTWIVVGYCAIGCIANAITPSKRECNLWLPVVMSMLALSLVVALS